MFWGLIMEPQRRYTQNVKKAFHISMASLDISTSDNGPAQLMCGYEGRNYLLCTLRKPDILQHPLDLNFEVGKEVSFATNGKCHVHLTGYLIDEDEEKDFGGLEALGEVSSGESEEEVEVDNKKKRKLSMENGGAAKKNKLDKVTSSQKDVEDEEESEDSDFVLEEASDSGEEVEGENDLGDSDEDDEDGDEEEDEEDGEEAEDEEDEDEEASSLSDNEVQPSGKAAKAQQKQNAKVKGEQNNKQNNKNQQQKKPEQNQQNNKSPQKRVLQGGLMIEDLKEGNGKPAKNGGILNVYYEGRLKGNNKVFDATKQGKGFSFKLGSGQVIKGWDVGMAGMKVGGKRRITCPPGMAYGKKGSPPTIPANSTLVFDVELKKIA